MQASDVSESSERESHGERRAASRQKARVQVEEDDEEEEEEDDEDELDDSISAFFEQNLAKDAEKMTRRRATIVETEDGEVVAGSVVRDGASSMRKVILTQRKLSKDPRISLSRQFSLFAGGGVDERRYQIEMVLLTLPIFGHHPEALIKRIAEQAVWRTYNVDLNIIDQKHPANALIVIISGVVGVKLDGTEIEELNEGDIWGEANMLGLDSKASATLTTLENTNLCEITHDVYLDIVYQWQDELRVYEEFMNTNRICMSDGTMAHTCEIFRGLSNSTLVGLDASLVRRIYFPGECILKEGTIGDSLVMLVRGAVDVEIGGKVVQSDARGECFVKEVVLPEEEKAKLTKTVTRQNTRKKSVLTDLRQHELRQQKSFGGERQSVSPSKSDKSNSRKSSPRDESQRTMSEDDDYPFSRQTSAEDEERQEVHSFGRQKTFGCDGQSNTIGRRLSSGSRQDSLRTWPSGDEFKPQKPVSPPNANRQKSPPERSKSVKFDSKSTKGGEVNAEAPICYGELGLLGIQATRSASIIAHSTCHVRILHRSVFMRHLEEHHESLESEGLAAIIKRRYHGSGVHAAPMLQTMKEIAMFQEVGCSEEFLDFLAQHLEERMFLSGQRIIDEEISDDRCMYILNRGKAKITVKGLEVGGIASGAVFGEAVCLGLASKRQSTVVAEELCYTQVLQQKDVVKGLEVFPEERQKVLMIAFKRGSGNDTVPTKPDGSPDWKANHVHAVIKAAQSHPIFGKIATGFIKELSNVSHDRIYMPGDLIIEEGSKGDSLFIMVSGQATVYTTKQDAPQPGKNLSDPHDEKAATATRIGMLTAGSISGELAMLGIAQKRSASVEAETICVMWEITHEKAMPIIDRFPDSRVQFLDSVCSHLEHTVSNCIDNSELFKKFDRKFRMLLGLYCERRAYFPGEKIFLEGTLGDGLYILNLGMGALERKGIPIRTCSPGATFNTTVMLGIHKQCFCTLTATHTCHVVIISRSSYVQALEQYPSQQVAHDLHQREKASAEEFRENIRRLCTRGLVWNKSQAAVAEVFTRMTKREPDSVILGKVWKLWTRYARESYKQRRERNNRKAAMNRWMERQRAAVAHRESGVRKEDLQSLDVGELPSIITPRAKVGRYNKLSSLYLGGRRDWEYMMHKPQTPRQQRFLGHLGDGSVVKTALEPPAVNITKRQLEWDNARLWTYMDMTKDDLDRALR